MKLTMHSLKASAAIAFAVAIGTANITPHAQAQRQILVHANIPFAFQVGKTVMPAGDYLITQNSIGSLELKNRTTGRDTVFAAVLPDEKHAPQGAGYVRFRHYGNTYFLSGVAVPYGTSAFKCQPGKQEKQLSRLANAGTDTQIALNTNAPARR